MNQVEVITLGCRLNSYESGQIEGHLRQLGAHDAIVINTCAVTSESVRQCKQTVRKMKRLHPEKKIILTGCATHIYADLFTPMPEVAGIVDNTEKTSLQAWAKVLNIPLAKMPSKAPITLSKTTRVRGFVEVQNGCDHRCTFCIIPYGRGPSRSKEPNEVLAQVRSMVAQGYAELTLTGVDLTSYEAKAGQKLGDLVALILHEVPSLARLRLSSLDVAEVDPLLFELISTHERLMPHMHLSLQAGDNMILKRMKRRHSREQAIAFCAQLHSRRPSITFGADLIAGFPTETDAMFANTLALVEDCQLSWLHVFPFSPREGTPAARMPQVDPLLAKERAAHLRAAGARVREKVLRTHIGTQSHVLIEGPYRGRTEHNLPVHTRQPLQIGQILPLTIIGSFRDSHLEALA